jgi:methionyl-tRNA formyltransferase
MRLAFMGTPPIAAACLAALHAAGHEIACVYSQPPRPRGRGQTLQPSPVQTLAETLGLAVRTPVSMKVTDEIEAFAALKLDAAVVVAFGQILMADVLEAPRLGCFNLHASLLPRWRGAAPIQRAIMAGDALTGCEVMRMTGGLDEGPVIAGVSLRIDALETAGTLTGRLAEAGADLLVEAMAAVATGRAIETPQREDGLTYAKKIKPAEARLVWTRPAEEIDRQIRGLSPFPGAWFEHDGKRVKALLSTVDEGAGLPGTVLDDALLIACGTGAVRLLRAQREGKAAQDAADFVRGYPLRPGDQVA